MLGRAGVLVIALASGCTPSTREAPTRERVHAASATTPADAASATPTIATPAEPPSTRCAADERRGEPWAALHALLARSPVPASFHCPADYRLVQRRPRTHDSIVSSRAPDGETFEFVGVDPGSGDVVLATLLRLDAVERRGDAGELDQYAYHRVVPEEPSHPLALVGPTLEPGRWYVERFAAREAALLAGPLSWLRERTTTDEAIDLVALEDPDGEGGREAPVILHHHAGTMVTICAGKGELRCWTRPEIRQSRVRDEGALAVRIELEPVEGPAETWSIDEALALKPADGAPAGALKRWTEATNSPSLAGLVASGRWIRTLGSGVVAVGRYETIGHATIARVPVTEWILRADAGRWEAVATPTMIVDAVIALGPALGVVEVRRVISEAGVEDSLRLLAFAPAEGVWALVGTLPALVGERIDDPRGALSWRHTITVDDTTACLRLGPGPFDGVTYDLETDAETAIDARARARFRAQREGWAVAADGWQPGCGRGGSTRQR